MAPKLNFPLIKSSRVIQCPYDAERFALTSDTVEPGYLVYVQNPTAALYAVIDVDNLDTEAGYYFLQFLPDLELPYNATVQQLLDAILPDQSGKDDYVLTSDGTNAEWRIVNTTGVAATVAEAIAATDDTKYMSPATTLAKIFETWSKDYYLSDGTTSNRAQILSPGAIGAVAGLPITFLVEFDVPTTPPAANPRIFSVSGSTAPSSFTATPNGLVLILGSSGQLNVAAVGSTFSDNRQLSYADFLNDYSGQRVRLSIAFSEGDSTTAPTITCNGVDISSSFTGSTGGTPPNWMDASLATTYFLAGYNWPSNEAPVSRLIIGALSDTEAATWTAGGKLPGWATFGGSAVDSNATVWANRSDGSSGFDTFTNATATGFDGVHLTGSTSYAGKSGYSIVSGRKYRVSFDLTLNSGVVPSTLIIREGVSIGSGEVTGFGTVVEGSNAFVVTATNTRADATFVIGYQSGDAGGDISLTNILIQPLGLLDDPIVQPALATDDRLGRMSRRIVGMTPVTQKTTGRIILNTATSGNEQGLGGAVLPNITDFLFGSDWAAVTATGTPTVKFGSASAGAQYKASAALSAGINPFDPVTRKPASTSIWVNSDDTTPVRTFVPFSRISTPAS